MIDFKKKCLAHMSSPELMGVNFYLVSIDPELAKDMLADNAEGQRNPSAVTIERYAVDILTDAWKFAGDPIRYSAAGELIDGQHRLAAIVEGAKPVTMLVITGLDPDVMDTIDVGRRRSLADYLRIKNPDIKYAKTIATIAARMWYMNVAKCYYTKGLPRQASATELNNAIPSHSQLMDTLLKTEKAIGTSFEQAAMMGHQAASNYPGITAATFATAYAELSYLDKDVREALFHELINGARTTAMGYPLNALRERLIRMAKNKNESWGIPLQHHFLNLVLNAAMAGQEINILRTPPSLSFPYIVELKVQDKARVNMGVDVPAEAAA